MKARIFFLAMAVFFSAESFSQSKDFRFRRKVASTDSGGWHSIFLPEDIFKNLKSDFSDLRIYQFSERDTIEEPYVLKIHQKEMTEEVFHPKIFNQTKKNGKQFFTLELPQGSQVNFIDLSFGETNFDGFATIEGSIDQKDWFEITKRQRIISIENQDISFYSAAIRFSTQNHRYLRVQLQVNKPLSLTGATLKKEVVVPGVLSKAELSWQVDKNKKSKKTTININLKDQVPITSMFIETNENADYYRTFRLERISDSTNTPKGWQYFYTTISQGYITSLDSNRFTFDFTSAKRMRLIIDDGDNSPLHIKDITLSAPKIELIARLNRGDHYLYYGCTRMSAPTYDLVHFKDKIPVSSPVLSISAEEKMIQEEPVSPPLIKNKVWLWVLMGVVIAVLTFFTLRMMKEKK